VGKQAILAGRRWLPFGRSYICVAIATALGFWAGAALAAPVQIPGAVQPGHERTLPQPAPAPTVDFSVVAPQRSPVPRAVDEIHFTLNDIHIEGAATIAPETFRPLYQNLIGKDVTLSNILDVADHIEQAYRDAGYLLVRAYVPPQHVRDGIFTIHVVEGFVATVSVEGGDAAVRQQIRGYLAPLLHEKPLRLASIERGLLLSNDLPGVAATGVLRPSPDVPGSSDLVVTVAQPMISGGLAANNRGSHFSGVWTVTGSAAYDSIFGDDQLAMSVTAAPDALKQIGGQLRYSTAIGDDGMIGSLIAAYTHGRTNLSGLQLKTDSWAVGPRLSYPLIRTRDETLALDGGFTVQDAKSTIFGGSISHDKWRVADLALTYSNDDILGGLSTGTLDLAQGVPGLGGTPDHSTDLSRKGGTTDFTKLTGVFHWTEPLFAPVSLALAAQGQYAFEPLIIGEQVQFGGTQIGRGYDPGAITGDQGVGGSAELRFDQAIPDWSIKDLQPYAFVDAARTWYIQRGSAFDPSLKNQSIISTGGGLRFWFPYNIYADVEVARMLDAVAGSDNGKRETKVLADVAVNF
jgi:hemolysin activation/secretion protein